MTSAMDQRTGASLNRGRSKQDYGTPRDFIAAVERRFGTLDFDIAASAENAKAERYWTIENDALTQPWEAIADLHAWLNPPFDDIKPWALKCAEQYRRVGLLHLLVPASIGTDWFRLYVQQHAFVEGLSPRMTFEGCSDPYPKDLALCTYGYGLTGFGTWRWRS